MDQQQLQAIGEQLRSLGHDRREVVQRILSDAEHGAEDRARHLYRELDRISEAAMALMEEQRDLIANELHE